MVPVKNLRFDCYLNRFKVQNQKQIVDRLVCELSAVTKTGSQTLSDLLDARLHKFDHNAGRGISIIDIKSAVIAKPVLLIGTLDTPIDLNAVDQKPIDIVAGVFSTPRCGTAHLQKLAKISRLLRLEDFCTALRACEDVDAMEVLFMPDQKWVQAA